MWSEWRQSRKFDFLYMKYKQAKLMDMVKSLESGYPWGEVIIGSWGSATWSGYGPICLPVNICRAEHL